MIQTDLTSFEADDYEDDEDEVFTGFPLLPHQLEFIEDRETKFIGLVGGYGNGKTTALCAKGVDLARLNIGYTGLLIEPTFTMIRTLLVPEMNMMLEALHVKYSYRSSPVPEYTLHFPEGDSTILLLSGENYQKMVGLNLAWFGIDEADTMKKEVIEACWNQAVARLRRGKVRRGFTTSTPEGFNFLHKYFVTDIAAKPTLAKHRRLIKGRTANNPFLPEDYIPTLMDTYPPKLLQAYLEGDFVNMKTGNVYYCFNRETHHTDLRLDDPKFNRLPLEIGMDFNVNNMSATLGYTWNNDAYVLGELHGLENTMTMIDAIQELANKLQRRVIVYPDSSGKNERSNASLSDIALLRKAGFEVKALTKNPFVKNRYGSVNAKLKNGNGDIHMWVNTTYCPQLTMGLEQQGFGPDGAPDKTSGLDHMVDAVGYWVYFKWPITGRGSLSVANY